MPSMGQVREYLSSWEILSPMLITLGSWSIIALERFFPYDKGQKLLRTGFLADFFLYTLLQSYLLNYLIGVGRQPHGIIRFFDEATGLSRLQILGHWPLWAQLVFFLVTHDLYIYWFHRLQHRSPVLWRLHEAHHAPKDVDWLSGSRSHPLEIVINQTIEYAPIFLLGAHPEMFLVKGTIDAVWGMWIHSNVNVRTGWLQKIINGPEMHRWHHSAVFTGYGFNYSTKLAVWDWLFGTAHLPAGEKPPAYGLGDDAVYPEVDAVGAGIVRRPVQAVWGWIAQTFYAFRPFTPAPTESASPESAGPAAS
jgi:sterol desaturase/sphingolipid hydroxylase (fatty acid hydroxylase superfamily)